MVEFLNECCNCGQPCFGNACPNRRVPHIYCDKCGKEVDTLYNYNDEQWCSGCILKDCGEVDFDE